MVMEECTPQLNISIAIFKTQIYLLARLIIHNIKSINDNTRSQPPILRAASHTAMGIHDTTILFLAR